MTALTATPQAPTATKPPSMLLQVTAAPSPPATAYTSNFTAGVDSWANVANATLTGNVTLPGGSIKTLKIDGPTTTADATAQRALTGLTAAAPHRYRATFAITRGEVKLVAKDTASGTVLAQTSFVTYGSPANKTVVLSLDFTPTATTVTIQIVIHQVTGFAGSTATVYAHTISVSPTGTWLGTTIYRTDANGVDVPVREDVGGLDTSGGTMTLTDWEAALVGLVSYRVVDGAGTSTAAAAVTHSPEARRNYIADPLMVAGAGWTGAPGGNITTGAPQAYSPNQAAVVGEVWTSAVDITAPAGSAVSGALGTRGTTAAVFGGNTGSSTPFTVPAGQTVRVVSTWQVAVNGGTTPDGVRLLLSFAPVAPAGTRITNALLEKGATEGKPLDGTTQGLGAAVRYWTGAVNGSPSVELGEGVSLGVWVTLPATAVPSTGAPGSPSSVFVPQVTGYEEEAATTGSIHQIVGRADKIANPGPLSTRSGTLELLELDYAQARAVRVLLANGDVAMLRQPTHLGLDLYFTTTSVRITPEGEETLPRRFTAAIGYEEVVAP